MPRQVTATGSFHAREQSTITAKVPGRLARIAVDIGSVVKTGDELAQIELTDYELRLRQAEAVLAQARAVVGLPSEGDDDQVNIEETATLRQAKALLQESVLTLERAKQLVEAKITPQSDLDAAIAAHAVAVSREQDAREEIRGRAATVAQRRAELNLARKQLADAKVRAPFEGVVHQRLAGLGEFVQVGTALVVLAAVDPLRLRLEVPERQSFHIRPGQPVRVTVGGDTNTYAAVISRVSPIITEGNRMLLVESDVPATNGLRPGLFAQAEIVVNENDPALCVPTRALSSFVGIEKVFVVKDGKAMERNVLLGRRTKDFVEVLSGVKANDAVVLDPGKLRSGQPVSEEKHAMAR